jgi:hypothetical protein
MKTTTQDATRPNGNKATKPTVNEESLKQSIADKSKALKTNQTIRK